MNSTSPEPSPSDAVEAVERHLPLWRALVRVDLNPTERELWGALRTAVDFVPDVLERLRAAVTERDALRVALADERRNSVDMPTFTSLQREGDQTAVALAAARARCRELEAEVARLRAMDDVPAFNAGWELRNGPCPREGDDGWSEAMEMGWLWAHAEKLRDAIGRIAELEAHVEHLKGVAKHQTERGDRWLAERDTLAARLRAAAEKERGA